LALDLETIRIVDPMHIWRLLEPRTLSDAVEHFLQRKHSGAHDALADVEETEAVLLAQLLRHAKSGDLPKSVQGLNDLCFPRDEDDIDRDKKFRFVNGKVCFTFGKWADKPVSEHLDYVRWMFDKGDFSRGTKKICQDILSGRMPVKPNGQTELSGATDSADPF
jgi:hypothetical protein